MSKLKIADHLHMNWGWGGYLNGWYDYDKWEDIDPNSFAGNATQYIYYQRMISNITPK
jgi:hypothetical protein